MKAYATDRSKIRQHLQEPIGPLGSSTHSDVNIVQIISGRMATDPTVNVQETVTIGTEMMKHYESKVVHPATRRHIAGWDVEVLFLKKSACDNHKETHPSRINKSCTILLLRQFP